MICGPVVPRNLEGLWDLVRRDPERLESGLSLIEEGLVIGEDLRVDALARDAAHGPVFLFAALGEEERSLPGRIMEAREWLQRNQGLLRQALPDQGMRLDREPRCMVVGFEFSEAFLRHLSAIEVGDLVVNRFETLVLDYGTYVGVNLLLGTCPGKRELNSVPEGPSGDARALGMQFVDLVKRMEPDCEVQGDRYARSFFADHGLLARLQVDGGRFRAFSPCGVNRRLDHQQEPGEVADAVLRYHAAMTDSALAEAADCHAGDLAGANDETVPRLVAGEISDSEHAGSQGQEENDAAADLGSAVGHTLEGLRRRMAKLKVSQEEYEAFGDLGASKVDE